MKIVIFGTGKAGRAILSYTLRQEHEIIAVVDNNEALWGVLIGKYKVSAPEEIKKIDFDLVLVAVMKEYYSVEEQLLSMEVPKDRIVPAVGWQKVKYMADELDEYFLVEKHTVPFEKKPVTGNMPSGEETKKAHARREREGFFEKYCQGEGLDIGCASDPVIPGCSGWDLPNGDAQYLEGIENESFDFVYSSHCLEHMRDVRVALRNWFRVVRKGGDTYTLHPSPKFVRKKKSAAIQVEYRPQAYVSHRRGRGS